MYTFFAIFLPSIIGIKIMDTLLKGVNLKNLLLYYLTLLLLSLMSNNLIMYYLFDINKNLFEKLNNSLLFFNEYCLISIIINIVIAVILVIIIKNIKIEVEVVYEKSRKFSKKSSGRNLAKPKKDRKSLIKKSKNQ